MTLWRFESESMCEYIQDPLGLVLALGEGPMYQMVERHQSSYIAQ
jgi:hypothetical protein